MKNWKKAKKWILAAVLLLLVVFAGVTVVKILGIKKSELPKVPVSERAASLGTIDLAEGKVKVAEGETKELYINTKTLNLYVKDKKTKTTWNAMSEASKKPTEMSLLTLSYLGEDNSLTKWDSYTYCVERETYSIEQLENGVRIHMNMNAGELANFYEFMPSKISAERYETIFIGGLEALKESGELESTLYEKYMKTLSLIYAKSKTESAYTVNYVGQPPGSAVTQLIQVAKLTGYTTEELLFDAEANGFTLEFAEPAEFHLVLEAVLENDELVVTVPGSAIESVNDYYVVQNIELLPNFALVQAKDVTDGYMLIPDGSGALMKLNSYQAKIPEYHRPVYESDFFKEYYYLSEYGADLMMPVFGMMINEGTKDPNAFLAIIESGTENAYITAKLGSADEADAGVVYNKIFATFDTVQYDNVKVFGEYSDNATSYLVRTEFMPIDYSVRYLLYPEQTGYYKMAKDYQSYLLRDEEGHEPVYQTEAELYLDVLAGVTLTDRILGIPYDYEASLTTVAQAQKIVEDLGKRNLILSYDGAYEGGLENTLQNAAELAKVNGSAEEWKRFETFLSEQGVELYLNASFLKIFNGGNGYVTKLHALADYSSDPVHIYGYHMATADFVDSTSDYHLLKPIYLKSVVDSFVASEDAARNLCLTDLATQYYADYDNGDMVMPHEAQAAVDEAIETLSANRKLAMMNPRADKLTDASVAVDISRSSSNYATFATSIPFRQLVMNGLCRYTTTNVNNNSKSVNYYLLQVLETGAIPKYTVMAADADVLKNSAYSYYYDVQYAPMAEEIKSLYDEYAAAMETIGTANIVNHTVLQENVFLTEYENGTQVITNYNATNVLVGETEIPGYGYQLTRAEKGE
ncbi:MAG: hypothetical protein IJY09_11045 [Lachnospiraceae bacterium]|nr:hypothetical protein [Lachnospiraceae bacterium]